MGGIVYAGGDFTSMGGQTRNRIAAVDSATGTITSWDPNADNYVYALVAHGTVIYVGGVFANIGGRARSCVAELDIATGVATSWNANLGDGTYPYVHSLAVGGNTLYAGGSFSMVAGQVRNNIAELDLATASVTPWELNADAYVHALAVRGDTLYAGGQFTIIGGKARHGLAALDATSGMPTAWNPNPAIPNSEPSIDALAVGGGSVYVGGFMSSIGGQSRNFVAAIDAATGMATDWNPNANQAVEGIALGGGVVYIGGYFTSVGGEPRSYIAALDRATGAVTAWNPTANGYVTELVADGSTIYAAGRFTSISGQPRNRIAALDATSGSATAWNPSANDRVDALALTPGKLYVGGWFTNIGGQPRNYIAAIDAMSGSATPWNPNADNVVFALAVSHGTVYAGGIFTNMDGLLRPRIAAVDESTGQATIWNPYADNYVNAIAVDGGTVYAGGFFASIGGQRQSGFAAILSDIPTPVLFSLVAAKVFPDRVELVWNLGMNAAELTIQRREPAGDWQDLATTWADGRGRVAVSDRDILPGRSYGYRVGLIGRDKEIFSTETWVDVPSRAFLSLEGFEPNPVTGRFQAAFTLACSDPATLELIDIGGRRVMIREVGGLGPGRHLVSLAQTGGLPAAIYWLRLSQGGRSFTKRGVVLR